MNRLRNIFAFNKNRDTPLTTEQRKDMEQAEHNRVREIEQGIVNMAMTLNQLINPGTTIMVDIKGGTIILPGQPNPGNSIIIFSKPANMQTIRAQVKAPEPGNGKV